MTRFTKYDEFFDSVRFVLRARATKDTKPAFTGLYSDGENIVCSDFRRLHFAPVKMQEGLFEVIKDSAAEIILGEQIDGQFPNYKQVIPFFDDVKPIKIAPWSSAYNSGASAAHYQLALAGVCVNYSYLEDAIKDTESRTTYVTGPESAVVVQTNLGTALVMPTVVKEEN